MKTCTLQIQYISTSRWVCFAFATTVSAADVNSDCKGWKPGTHQNVSIGAGNTVVLEGPACTALRDVNVTLRCGVG